MGINLGDKVKDKVTGLEGIAVAKHEYLWGCVRFSIQPSELKDGKPVDVAVVDEPQLDVVARGAIVNVPHWRYAEDTGANLARKTTAAGPRNDPSRPSVPSR